VSVEDGMAGLTAQGETAGLLAEVVRGLSCGLGEDLVAVVLFGSRARGEANPGSDWDLLVVARGLPGRTLERHFRLKAMLPDVWRGQVALLAKTPAEFEARLPALYLDIALDGVVLYDTGGYMGRRLAYLRELLRRRGLQRARSGRDIVWRWQQAPPPEWALEWEGAP